MTWPNNADGDVLRSLEAAGFRFTESHTVDYNVDFRSWPPASEALAYLHKNFGNVTLYEPDEDSTGYVQFQETGPVSYDRVVEIQAIVSDVMAAYGGVCDSWGVFE